MAEAASFSYRRHSAGVLLWLVVVSAAATKKKQPSDHSPRHAADHEDGAKIRNDLLGYDKQEGFEWNKIEAVSNS